MAVIEEAVEIPEYWRVTSGIGSGAPGNLGYDEAARKMYWRNRKRKQRARWGAATALGGYERAFNAYADVCLAEAEHEAARLPDPPRWQDAYSDEKWQHEQRVMGWLRQIEERRRQ